MNRVIIITIVILSIITLGLGGIVVYLSYTAEVEEGNRIDTPITNFLFDLFDIEKSEVEPQEESPTTPKDDTPTEPIRNYGKTCSSVEACNDLECEWPKTAFCDCAIGRCTCEPCDSQAEQCAPGVPVCTGEPASCSPDPCPSGTIDCGTSLDCNGDCSLVDTECEESSIKKCSAKGCGNSTIVKRYCKPATTTPTATVAPSTAIPTNIIQPTLVATTSTPTTPIQTTIIATPAATTPIPTTLMQNTTTPTPTPTPTEIPVTVAPQAVCGNGVIEPGEICESSVFGSCGAGSTCNSNCECEPDPNIRSMCGSSCNTDLDCPADNICKNNKCAIRACIEGLFFNTDINENNIVCSQDNCSIVECGSPCGPNGQCPNTLECSTNNICVIPYCKTHECDDMCKLPQSDLNIDELNYVYVIAILTMLFGFTIYKTDLLMRIIGFNYYTEFINITNSNPLLKAISKPIRKFEDRFDE